MDESERQKPLLLKFESKRFWPDLRRELNVDQTGAAIILDICNVDGWVSYSRANRFYQVPDRYRNPLFTWRAVVGQVDHLDRLRLVEHDRRPPGPRGWQSALRATPALREICDEVVRGKPLDLAPRPEVVLLRDEHGRLLDYPETRDIDRMRRRCERLNEALRGADIDPMIKAPLARIFNKSLQRGGRLYAMGNSWQNMKAEARRCLTIDGEPVVELDYRTLHPAIAYAEASAAMPSDCYDIRGWPRKLVKVAMLTLINAPTKRKARLSIAHSHLITGHAEPGSQEAMRVADRLIDDIKRVHRPIAHAFHSDAGARFMTIDAQMAESVMHLMLMQGVVILPVHDSFLVPASKRDQLEGAMLEVAQEIGLWAVEVEAK